MNTRNTPQQFGWEKLTWLLPALFAVVLLVPYAVTSLVYTGDLRDIHAPLEDFYRSELRAGRLPLWDPAVSFGFPVLASSQIGFWYPPLFVLRVFRPEVALAMTYVGHGILLALGLFWYARKLGQSRPAATLAALAFTGSGFTVGHLPQTNVFVSIAWLPLTLLLADTLAETLRRRVAVALGAVLALSALSGHFQIAFLVAACAGARLLFRLRAVFRTVPWHHTVWTWLLLIIPLSVGVLLLSAAQLVPTLELTLESTRGPGGGFDLVRANQHSFPPWQAILFVLPAFFGFPDLSEYWGTRPLVEMATWVGVMPLLLALVGVLPARGQHRFWIATALVGFVLALGRWSPLRLLGVEPTLGIFSAPARYLVVTQFALAILAGAGLDRLRSGAPGRARRVIGLTALATAVAITALFAVVRTRPDTLTGVGRALAERFVIGKPAHVLPPEAYAEKIDYLLNRLQTWGVNLRNPMIALSLVLLTAGGAVVLVSGRVLAINSGSTSQRQHPLVLALVTATALELVVIAWRVHPRVAWAEVARESPVVARLREEPRGRLYVVHPQGDTGLVFANRTTSDRNEHERLLRDLAAPLIAARAGIPGIDWPAALDFAHAARVLAQARDALGRPIDEERFDRLGVRYVAGSTVTPGLDLPSTARELLSFGSGEDATVRLWERPTARRRAELFPTLPSDMEQPLPAHVGSAEITEETTQRIMIRVENPLAADGTLVLRDTFYPGWRAAVDGAPAAIERAETIFRAVTVPPGKHTVTFSYRPWTVPLGLALSGLAWAVALSMLLRRTAR